MNIKFLDTTKKIKHSLRKIINLEQIIINKLSLMILLLFVPIQMKYFLLELKKKINLFGFHLLKIK